MENCLEDFNLSWCVVYLDDIIVFGTTQEEHLQRLAAVFENPQTIQNQVEALQI